jgi:hypothetical protein
MTIRPFRIRTLMIAVAVAAGSGSRPARSPLTFATLPKSASGYGWQTGKTNVR